MIIQCLDNSESITAVKYTLNFILENCGIFFRWTTDPSDKFLTICYSNDHELQTNNKILLPKYIDLETIHQDQLHWNNYKIDGTDIPVLGLKKDNEAIIPFDIIASIYFHLACIEELNYKHPDDVSRSIEKRLLFNYDKFKSPVVDILVKWFVNVIKLNFPENLIILKSQYPNNEPFGIAITHDVDFITAFHPLKFAGYKILSLCRLINRKKYNELQKRHNDKWPFKELLEFYSENNIKATFNFIARYTENLHFRYRIASRRMKKLFNLLTHQGHEIGLHPSRYIFENISRFKKEKLKLEKLSRNKIYGMRHHYLRTLFPFIWALADKFQIAYDSTMAFRDYAGFRAGTSLPFNGFDHLNQKQLNCVEFPTVFFESSLATHNPDQSLNEIKKILSAIKANTGMATILWHTNNMNEPGNYHKIWDQLIEIIRSSNGYIATLKKHLEWIYFRNNIQITDIGQDNDLTRISILKPDGFSLFSLNIQSEILKIENAEFEIQNETTVLKSKSSEQKIILYLRSR